MNTIERDGCVDNVLIDRLRIRTKTFHHKFGSDQRTVYSVPLMKRDTMRVDIVLNIIFYKICPSPCEYKQ